MYLSAFLTLIIFLCCANAAVASEETEQPKDAAIAEKRHQGSIRVTMEDGDLVCYVTVFNNTRDALRVARYPTASIYSKVYIRVPMGNSADYPPRTIEIQPDEGFVTRHVVRKGPVEPVTYHISITHSFGYKQFDPPKVKVSVAVDGSIQVSPWIGPSHDSSRPPATRQAVPESRPSR
jgi:hypothetical protein